MTRFVTFTPASLSAFTAANSVALAAGWQQNAEAVHVSTDGDKIYAVSAVDGAGKGTVSLSGHLGLLPFRLEVGVALSGSQVELSLELIEPFKAGPLSWKFNINGGNVELAEAPSAQGTVAAIDYWCALKCGAVAILPTLVACVPAIAAGGPAGYIACVTAKVGTADAAGIAACIASKCL